MINGDKYDLLVFVVMTGWNSAQPLASIKSIKSSDVITVTFHLSLFLAKPRRPFSLLLFCPLLSWDPLRHKAPPISNTDFGGSPKWEVCLLAVWWSKNHLISLKFSSWCIKRRIPVPRIILSTGTENGRDVRDEKRWMKQKQCTSCKTFFGSDLDKLTVRRHLRQSAISENGLGFGQY